MNNHHVIRRQHLHVTFEGTEPEGFALQHRLSALCHDWLVPAIETALDRCAPPDGHLYIEHLTIDAGAFRPERLEHDLAGRVAQAIEKAILEQTQPTSVQGHFQHKTEHQAALEAIIHFLKNGHLPWSFRLPPGTDLEPYLLTLWEKTAIRPSDVAQMDQGLLAPMARRRLVLQFSDGFLEKLLQSISPQACASVRELRTALGDARPAFQKRLWETAFAQAVTGGDTGLAALALKMKVELIASSPSPETRLIALLDSLLSKSAPLLNPQSTWPVNLETRPLPNEGVYVDNAGLVILHPFLPKFFEGLGLAQEGVLLQPDRALHLLHYLCTGHSPAPEYTLALPKVLCNIPLEDPVDIDLFLTEPEKEEALVLLQAVIRHWEALQNAAPDALRGTFLLRPGKLSRRDDGGWLLQVEKQGFDILLDQLPWSIGMIQLPWMEGLLWVEWN